MGVVEAPFCFAADDGVLGRDVSAALCERKRGIHE